MATPSQIRARWTVIGLVVGLVVGLYAGAQWYCVLIVAANTAFGFSVGFVLAFRRRPGRGHVITGGHPHIHSIQPSNPHRRSAA